MPEHTNVIIERKIREGQYDEVFEFYNRTEKINGEVHMTDENGNLCTLELKGDMLEYIQRGTPTDPKVVGLRITPDGAVTEFNP